MTTAQPPDWFLAYMARIVELYPQWHAKPGTASAYWFALHDLEPHDLVRALHEHAAQSPFAPTAADLRKHALPPDRNGMSAAEAWDEMRRNRRKYSPYATHEQNARISWSSEIVRRSAEAVCWTDMNWELEQIPTIRAQFERYYNALASKQEQIDNRHESEMLMQGIQEMIGPGNNLLGGAL